MNKLLTIALATLAMTLSAQAQSTKDYLDFMATPHITITSGQQGSIDLKQWVAGFTTELTYTLPATDHLTLSMEGSTLHVATAPDWQGIKFFELTVTDAEGTEMQRRLAVCSLAEGAAGISNVKREPTADSRDVYNLQGQRLATPVKGINIVNGRKVIVK